MDDNVFDLLAAQKSAVFLCVGAAGFVLVCAFLFRRMGKMRAASPKASLQRIRVELHLLRDDMQQYPATREVHEIVDGLYSCERTIDKVVAKL
jgi:hypothetical protein